jgi:hypothetical protein
MQVPSNSTRKRVKIRSMQDQYLAQLLTLHLYYGNIISNFGWVSGCLITFLFSCLSRKMSKIWIQTATASSFLPPHPSTIKLGIIETLQDNTPGIPSSILDRAINSSARGFPSVSLGECRDVVTVSPQMSYSTFVIIIPFYSTCHINYSMQLK